MSDRPEWFAAKRYGYGAGFPIAWQGWAITFGYLALMYLAARFLEPPAPAFWIVFVFLTAALMWIGCLTTKGGWRWRWGERD